MLEMQQLISEEIAYAVGSSSRRFILQPSVLKHLRVHRQRRWWQSEAGGQLFARFSADGDVDVVHATGPRCSDRRSRWSYVPDPENETDEIIRMHKQGLHYIGDWHTHPQAIPSPSGQDILTLQQCFRLSKHNLNAFMLVVVGRASFPKGLYVAAVDAQGAHVLMSEPPDAVT